jgi:microcystin-dependent protein
MKYFVATGLALAMGATAYAGVRTFNIGFGAPSVSGETNITDPEKGAIFLDTSVNPPVFKGNRGTPSSPDWAALSSATPVALPSGSVFMTAATNCPSGTLPTDGASLLRDDHLSLFAAIGTTYGSVDADHFNVPNTGGVFVRGAGSQTIDSITYTGTRGVSQSEATKATLKSPGGGQIYSTPSYGAQALASQYPFPSSASGGVGLPAATWPATSGTGDETRPANIVLNYCIVD